MPVDPASLFIVHYPDPVLRARAADVPTAPEGAGGAGVTDEVRAVADRMLELMFDAPGIGLAAPQVGLSWRMFVCHVLPEDREESAIEDAGDSKGAATPRTSTAEPMVFINPVLSDPVGPVEWGNEGCLSLPQITGDVQRPRTITVRALDREGEPFTLTATGLLARCVQHEYDHLDGVLILDKLSPLSRLRTRSAVRGLEKAAGVR